MTAKAERAKSREYLESVLLQCRQLIPGWMFAVIHRAALPQSGGNAARNRRLSAMERMLIEETPLHEMSTPELKTVLGKLDATLSTHERRGRKTEALTKFVAPVRALLEKREQTSPTVSGAKMALAKGASALAVPPILWEVAEVCEQGVFCQLCGMKSPLLLANPADIQLEEGDIVEATNGEIGLLSDSTEPHTLEDAEAIVALVDEIDVATTNVSFQGPTNAVLVFVSASPSPLELARKESLVGPDGAFFTDRYLSPLGLTREEVATGFAIPITCEPTEEDIDLWRGQLLKSLAAFDRAKVVALGRVAKQALGPLAVFSLPHPAAVRRHGDRGEVDRKVRAISKALDINVIPPQTLDSQKSKPSEGSTKTKLADSISELSKGESLRVAVTKSVAEKQIVYGVILDPYQVDLQGDWLPPAEIETTAHDFLTKSRVVGLQHKGVAEAQVVESWVEVYPSPEDREHALQNLPHSVYRRQFGTDTLHSGSWVAGVKLNDSLWAQYERGDLDAFSIGGFSFKTQISSDAMPQVDFVDLQPSP